ncbi:MAG TPA: hypothetical protein VK612_11735, partial [Pyrinomonadaceae bacterium]|nr:hypothetical protein [Pyrinomonadaceae bacterium]
MKIIDECVPGIVKRGLPERKIVSVQDMGWAGVKNGKLLKLIAAEFDVFITSDKNLRYQQNLGEIDVAIILLRSNQVPVVKELLPEIDQALTE